MSTGELVIRRTDIYDDPLFNYAQFWNGRDYEHQAEVAALDSGTAPDRDRTSRLGTPGPHRRPGLAFILPRLRNNYVR
jgi:hypothetical protein